MGRRPVAQALAREDLARRDASARGGHAWEPDAPRATSRAGKTAGAPGHDDVHRAGPGRGPGDGVERRRRGDARAQPVEVVAIFGPTASGKSAVAEAVAGRLGTEVVSADAMQVYRGLPILTNQPSRPTRLVGILGLEEEMSVGAYAPLAHAAIDELVAARGTAVVAGGTGLYLRAALAELGVPRRAEPAVRERVRAEVEADREAAHRRLARLDPAAAAAVHPNDRKRVVRALELAEAGSSLVRGRELWSSTTRRPTLVVGLEVEPAELTRRIRARAEEMFRRGVVAEVRAALAAPLSPTAAKTLGLREIAEHEPAAALERIVVRTARYAAYQRKWMRRIPGLVRLGADRPAEDVAAEIVARVRR